MILSAVSVGFAFGLIGGLTQPFGAIVPGRCVSVVVLRIVDDGRVIRMLSDAGGSGVGVLGGTTIGVQEVCGSCRDVSEVEVSAAGGVEIGDSSGCGEMDVEETGAAESDGDETGGEEIIGEVSEGEETDADETGGDKTVGDETGEVSALVEGEPAMMVSGGSTG